MRDVGWNLDHNYSFIPLVIRDPEGHATCIIGPFMGDWIVVRWFDTILKMLKPEEEKSFIILPVFGARINSPNRPTVSKLQRHQRYWID
jgi:hypothetical protein